MGLIVTTEPTTEPVTLAEAKVHLRIDDYGTTYSGHIDIDAPADPHPDDDLVTALIKAARLQAEAFTDRRFITTVMAYSMENFPAEITLPTAPVASVDSITYIDDQGDSQTLASDQYQVDTTGWHTTIRPAYGATWPSVRSQYNNVTVAFTAGYGSASDVPEDIKAAIKLTLGHLYRHREDTTMAQTYALTGGAKHLLAPYRLHLL